MTDLSYGLRAGAAIGLVLALAGCPAQQPAPPVRIDGTAPGGGQPVEDARGIVAFEGYEAARARDGETVGDLAGRIGYSATELAAYNGLSPTSPLRAGDLLVLPPRPGGASAVGAPLSSSPAPLPSSPPPASVIETQPLGTDPVITSPGDSLLTETTPATPEDTADAGAAPSQSPLPNESGWSPELALQAIERSSGAPTEAAAPVPAPAPEAETTRPGEGAPLSAPPSAGTPLPPEPAEVTELTSPDLSRYQTARTSPQPAPVTVPGLASPRSRLARPVEGPVALGFGEGEGGVRNEGVDFAAPAGASVIAAEDGEVALVSEALGGLGTIVLIRHDGDLLTVYGRISGVTVARGDPVVRGQEIGVVAQPSGGVAPRMHFEVRQGATSVDPLRFL
ncbi:MAG: peptidoglycan DD-metalloendopeptidase family protein [Pikeienuella sp.]